MLVASMLPRPSPLKYDVLTARSRLQLLCVSSNDRGLGSSRAACLWRSVRPHGSRTVSCHSPSHKRPSLQTMFMDAESVRFEDLTRFRGDRPRDAASEDPG